MADHPITTLIKDANWARVRDAVLWKYPKENGYTNEQWIAICIKRQFTKKIVNEHEEFIAMDAANQQANTIINAARATINVPDDITE